MSRQEFTAKTMDQAFEKSKDTKGVPRCRKCAGELRIGKFQFDHLLPCALGGTNELANCQVLCEACHGAKTDSEDIPRIRKADRQRKAHIGALAPKQKIKSAGFPPTKPSREPKASLPPRPMFRDARS